MASKNVTLTDKNGDYIYPLTYTNNIFTKDNRPLEDVLENLELGVSHTLDTVDQTSNYPVASSALYTEFQKYLPLAGGDLSGDLNLPLGKYLKTENLTVLGKTTSELRVGNSDTVLQLRGKNANPYYNAGGDDVEIALKPDLEDYLSLTAGDTKPLTGDLYIKDGTTEKSIFLGNGPQLRTNTNGGLIISSGTGLYFRKTTTGSTGSVTLQSGQFRPETNNDVILGSSSIQWKEIYGKAIYQDSKQVANKEDLDGYLPLDGNAVSATKATQDGDGNVIKDTYLKLSGGTLTGAVNLNSGFPQIKTNQADLVIQTQGGQQYDFTDTEFRPTASYVDTLSIGRSDRKFKDAYFSGTVNANLLSGDAVYNRASINALTAAATWSNNSKVPTLTTLAYWDGRYATTNNASNLSYSKNGVIVGTTSTQTISGQKTFSKAPYFTAGITRYSKSSSIDNSAKPSDTTYQYEDYLDKNNSRIGVIGVLQNTDGYSGVYLQARNKDSISIVTDGTNVRTHAPTPTATANDSQIATTEWVKARGVYQHVINLAAGSSGAYRVFFTVINNRSTAYTISDLKAYLHDNGFNATSTSNGSWYPCGGGTTGGGAMLWGISSNGSRDGSTFRFFYSFYNQKAANTTGDGTSIWDKVTLLTVV